MHFGFFPSFFDRPLGFRFTQQEDDEIIELMLRQHWIVNVPWIFISLILFTIPVVLLELDRILNFNIALILPSNILLGVLILWYLLILAYIIEKFLYWYFNIYIVTDRHLVDINFHSLLNRDITEILIKDVESSSSRIKGIIRSLFNFGDVIIETAASVQNIEFIDVPKPDVVTDRIHDLKEAAGGNNG